MAVVIVECSDGDVVVVDRDIASRWSAAIRAKLGTPPWPIFAPLPVASFALARSRLDLHRGARLAVDHAQCAL